MKYNLLRVTSKVTIMYFRAFCIASHQLKNEKGVYFAIIIMVYFLKHKSPEMLFADVCIPIKRVV